MLRPAKPELQFLLLPWLLRPADPKPMDHPWELLPHPDHAPECEDASAGPTNLGIYILKYIFNAEFIKSKNAFIFFFLIL